MRLKHYNYDTTGCVFITICTKNRECLLSEIIERDLSEIALWDDSTCVKLTNYGEIADKYINQLNDFYANISVESYVIMPNHIHLLLHIHGSERTAEDVGPYDAEINPAVDDTFINDNRKTLISKFVATFKRFCNKEIGFNIWQPRSYDHVIRNKRDFDEHVKYITENPMKWRFDKLYCE